MNLYAQAAANAQQAGEDTSGYAQPFQDAATNAAQAFQDAIAFVPQEYDNYVSLADVYNAVGESLDKQYFDDAVKVAQQGLRVEPWGTAIRQQLARALIGQGKTDEAAKVLVKLVELDPTNGQAALQYAGLLDRQGETEEALAVLQRANAILGGQPGVDDAIATLQAKLESKQ